jgi:hypothetical protein
MECNHEDKHFYSYFLRLESFGVHTYRPFIYENFCGECCTFTYSVKSSIYKIKYANFLF